jgi:hypothetical protein
MNRAENGKIDLAIASWPNGIELLIRNDAIQLIPLGLGKWMGEFAGTPTDDFWSDIVEGVRVKVDCAIFLPVDVPLPELAPSPSFRRQ